MSSEIETVKKTAPRECSVSPCNLRASGLLSNESTRHLRSIHDTFARAFSHALDLFLGSPIELKLVKIDQTGAREFGTTVATGSYLVPFSLHSMPERVVAKFEHGLLFQLLDLLMGGTGDPLEQSREVTEIDEELFRAVTDLMSAQLERAWKVCNVNVSPLPSVKPAMLGQLFALEERVVMLWFELRLGATNSSFALVFPATFTSALVRNSQAESIRRVGAQSGTMQRLRDRMLNCEMLLSVDLPALPVRLGELVALEVGSVLNLRVPETAPIEMNVGGQEIFEVRPMRRGGYKAAEIKTLREMGI